MKESITLTLNRGDIDQAIINYITKQGYKVDSFDFTLGSDDDDGPGYPRYHVNGLTAKVRK